MERSRLLLYLGAWDLVQKSMKVAERDAADAYAGPNKSFPLYKSGKHLAAAWNLAGHADDPQEVRRNILAFARKHGLMDHLPMDAQHMANVMEITRKAFADGEWPDLDRETQDQLAQMLARQASKPEKPQSPAPVAKKATSDEDEAALNPADPTGANGTNDANDAADDLKDDALIRQLVEMAFQHEAGEGDTAQWEALRNFCHANGLDNLIPAAAPAVRKAETGDGIDAGDNAQKAQTPAAPEPPQMVVVEDEDGIPVTKSMLITKSWQDASGDVYIEGWVSTEARDQQKDIVPPEAFKAALPEYMARYAPLTTEHQLFPNLRRGELSRYPVGHMQRIALVRDGQILQEHTHPKDPAEFAHFPGSGTGAYGRGVINDYTAASQVMKGNMAGFSWVGRLKEYEPLPDGGKRYGRIDPWMETTLSAFPVNSSARLLDASRAKPSQE